MNKQELENRIIAINNEMQQLKANYAKLEGHMGETQHWLTTLLKFESEQEQTVKEEESGEIINEGAGQD